MTIHNLKFQGTWDPKRVRDITGLPQYYFAPDKLEAYKDANYLKGGIVYADRVTTASSSPYKNEYDTEVFLSIRLSCTYTLEASQKLY